MSAPRRRTPPRRDSVAEVTEIALDPVWDVGAKPKPADVKAADRLEPWSWLSGPDDIERRPLRRSSPE